MKPYSSSVTGLNCLVRLQKCEEVMGWCTAQCKMLLFCVKTIVKVMQLWTSLCEEDKEEEKERKKYFGRLATFWFGTLLCHWLCCSWWKHSKMSS